MNEINRVLRRAGALLLVTNLVRWFVLMLAVALSAAIVAVIVTGVLSVSVDWRLAAKWSALVVVVASVVGALVTRPRASTIARRVDEGADLRESLSTALSVANDPSPWSRATVESAGIRARGVRVAQAVPVRAPRFWPAPIALGLALVIVAIVFPRDIDVLGWAAKDHDAAEEKAQIIKAEAVVDETIKAMEQIAASTNMDLKLEPQAPEAEAKRPEPKTPEETILKALSDVTEMKDRLDAMRSGDDGAKLDALRDQLAKLRSPSDGPLQKLAQELSKGNFKEAADALKALQDKLDSGQMSDAEKAQLEKQLERLAEQLEKLAEDRKDLERQLDQAGLDKSLASDPEALKKAMENAQNLSDAQKQQLMKMAQAQQGACSACESMSQGMKSMSQAMSQGEMGEMGDAFSGMQGQLSQMEMLEAQMSALDAAKSKAEMSLAELSQMFSECEGGQCDGMGQMAGLGQKGANGKFKSGDPANRPGAGSGGPGQGNGNSSEEEAAFATKTERPNVNTEGGPIIGSRLVEGEQVKGESRETFKAAVAAGEERMAEAIDTNVYPKEYHETIKRYYGNLKQRGGESKDAGAGEGSSSSGEGASGEGSSGDSGSGSGEG